MPKCISCNLDVPEIFPIDLELRDKLKKADPSFPGVRRDGERCADALVRTERIIRELRTRADIPEA